MGILFFSVWNVQNAYADTIMQPPTSSTYIDVSELNTAETDYGLTDGTNAQAVYFGTNRDSSTAQKQKWWIAGYDESGLVLMCDPQQPLKTGQLFNLTTVTQGYQSAYGTYESTPANELYPNHYGASEIRRVLNSLATDESIFTKAEQAMMKDTTVYTYDYANNATYSTTDKLYLAACSYNSKEVTVGQNAVDSSKSGNEKVHNGLKIGLKGNEPYGSPFQDSGSMFWTRSPDDYYNIAALEAAPSLMTYTGTVDQNRNNVVPAFALDSGSVLFASSAAAGTASANTNEGSPMTFRCDGSAKINSTVKYTPDSVSVDYKDTGRAVYLYVQGSEEGDGWIIRDWVSSRRIEGSVNIPASAIRSDANLTNCKIWLETVEDNIAYAKPAQFEGEFPPPLYGFVDIPAVKKYTYTGKEIRGGRAAVGYSVSGPLTGTSVGVYMVTAILEKGYYWSDGTTDPKTIVWTIVKAPNPMKLKTKTATVKRSLVKKKAQKLLRSKVLTFTKTAKGKVTYTKLSGSGKLSISKTTGNVTVKKNTKKGTYRIKVKVRAAGNGNYKALSKNVTLTVKVQ